MQGVRYLAGVACAAALFACAIAPAASSAKPRKKCPENTSAEFYANPVVDRSGYKKPTGVKSPKACAFPTLTEAVESANAVEDGYAIARGAKRSKPATFNHETFPIVVGNRTTLTTYEDPDPNVGGPGLNPKHYVVNFKSPNSGEALMLEGDFPFGGVVRGLTLKNARRSNAKRGFDVAMLLCAGPGVEVTDVALDGKSKKGGTVDHGLMAAGNCGGSFSGLSAHDFAVTGAVFFSSETVNVAGSKFDDNQTGVLLDDGVVDFQDSTFDDNAGDGIFSHDFGRPLGTGIGASGNGGSGLRIQGLATLDDVQVTDSGGPGVLVETFENVQLSGLDVSGSGTSGSPDPGVLVTKTGAGTLTLTGDRSGGGASTSSISGNAGDGIHVGPSAADDISVAATDIDVSANQVGVALEDSTSATEVALTGMDVFRNSDGAVIEPVTASFSQNKFHNNALNQIVFDGGGSDHAFSFSSPACDGTQNAVYGYSQITSPGYGIYARNGAHVTSTHTTFEGGGEGDRDLGVDGSSSVAAPEPCT